MVTFKSCAKVPERGGRGYVCGGGLVEVEGRVMWGGGRVHVLDEANSRWQEVADGEIGAKLAAHGTGLVSVGGLKGGLCSKEVMELREGRWSFMSDMLIGFAFSCVLEVSGVGVVVMGGQGSGRRFLSDVQVFDDKTQAWRRGPSLPQPCGAMSAVVYGNQIFVMGGVGMDRAVWYATVHDLTTSTLDAQLSVWRKLPDVPYMYSSVCVVEGVVLAIGGAEDQDGSKKTSAIYALQNVDQTWTHIGDLPFKCAWVETLLLSGGGLLLVDGRSQQVLKIDVEDLAKLFPTSPKAEGSGVTEHMSLDSEPSLPHLVDKVAAVIPHKYEIVGLQLGFTLAELQEIRPPKQSLETHQRAFGEIFDVWRKHESPPYTWRTIIGVLRSASVGEATLSEQLISWIASTSGITGVIPSPIGLKADSVSSTTVSISWQPPDDMKGFITEYQVNYTMHGGSEQLHEVQDTTSTELASLEPDTKYTVRVRARVVEFGDYSTPITIHTTELLSEMVSKVLENYKAVTFKNLKIVKLIFYGAPRAGKSTLRKQLLRHVEGIQLQPCGTIEPSTLIAEVCDPIFVERIVATEESSEWKWTVQKLDDIAKALLRCFSSKKLQLEVKSSSLPIASINPVSIENNVQPKPTAEPQQSVETTAAQDRDTAPSPILPKTIIDPIHSATVIETSQSIGVNINVEEVFRNAVETGKWADIVQVLNIDNAMFLQIIDGGGQPSFQEIFPLLISGPSVTLLIFKLTDDLDTLYEVQYQPENQSEGPKVWADTYSVKDIISHALSSFISQTNATSFQCSILLVGTHKDKLEVSQDHHQDKERKEKIFYIAKQLHGWLCQSKAFESIRVKSIESFITGIDNSNKQDIVSVKKKIEEIISQLNSKDIPAPWLVFDFVLHKYAKLKELRKLGKSDCKDIAKRCGVKDEEVDVVLHYLHFEAGTLLYYSDIPKLNQYVIIDFQLIFDSISKIIIQYFDYNSEFGAHLKQKELFKKKGQLDTSVLRPVEGCLEVDELLSLLNHRHIISKLEGTSMFFMPSVLPKVKLSYNDSSNSSSFLVSFDHGCCPVGLFCAATTRLIVKHKWEIIIGKDQFRNKIDFYCKCSKKSYNVIFSAFSAHYEVCLMEEAMPDVKYVIYQNIAEVFATICTDMNYPFPSYGFYCPETCKYGDVSYQQYQHPALCEFSSESQEMKCCYSDKRNDLTQEHKQWYTPPQEQEGSQEQKKDSQSSQPIASKKPKTALPVPTTSAIKKRHTQEDSQSSQPIASKKPKTADLLECSEDDIYIITAYDFDWRRVGRRLIGNQKIRDIDCDGRCEGDKKERMLLQWKESKSHDATYQALVNVLREVENKATADLVQELERKRCPQGDK